MTAAYWACAAVTGVSAAISLGFSLAEVRRSTGHRRTVALYVSARSFALMIVSFIPLFRASIPWLSAIALAMILVQVCDAGVGASTRNRMKTYGPAGTALLNALALVWLYH